eukprot:TRINITY_DN3264_c0_g4_i4.p1 TRINITY_DN3264_c0_g4~~TRINITY_DN3264_c0_g4_i4.p1  ORF type:complete len:102 (+),score=10.21 TRINITY_DN3264_c0_g4_i4:278-583(+)
MKEHKVLEQSFQTRIPRLYLQRYSVDICLVVKWNLLELLDEIRLWRDIIFISPKFQNAVDNIVNQLSFVKVDESMEKIGISMFNKGQVCQGYTYVRNNRRR